MAFLGCTSLSCPRLKRNDLPLSIPASQLERDGMGNYWCKDCSKCCVLINWGKAHKWPATTVAGKTWDYSTLPGYADWFSSVALGSRDLIESMYRDLIEAPEQVARELAGEV